jgi:hypothetical protein
VADLFFGLSSVLYVRVMRDAMLVRDVVAGKEVRMSAVRPFTGRRLLVGDFPAAEETLKKGMVEVMKGRAWFRPAPVIVMHPLEMIEGGMSQVEARLLYEMAMGAGAAKAIVWSGEPLSDPQVNEKAREKARAP